jgi:hypothetical protein
MEKVAVGAGLMDGDPRRQGLEYCSRGPFQIGKEAADLHGIAHARMRAELRGTGAGGDDDPQISESGCVLHEQPVGL